MTFFDHICAKLSQIASNVTGLDPHGALYCVMGASLITVPRNDPDVVAVYNGVVVFHSVVKNSKQDNS